MQINLQIFENTVATSQAVAELIKEKANATPTDKFLNLAVSGGTTPRMLFDMLGNEYETSIDWKKVRFFWVDERCVEPTDPESNFGMTYDAFLQKTFVPGENIFRIRGEEIPEFEAERYSSLLRSELPASVGYPVFDLVLLGMGNDGHTASIFPNDLSLIDSELSVAVNVNPYTLQKRITLTGNTINNAHQIVFMITGENKSKILKEIIQKKPTASNYPAAHIATLKGKVDFYVDKTAASLL
ncbi:MAG: 6-phosphogluconolactonase [Paludibacter sp.]